MHTTTESERALDDACLTTHVSCDVEHGRLALMQGRHHLEALDRRIAGFQRLEASHRPDQLLERAMVSLDETVQILNLPV